MSENKVLTITNSNFDEVVLNSDKPVLVDFWATWCGPCRMVSPLIEELADEYGETAVVGKVNVDDESELASKFRIMSIPTVMLFKNGQAVEKIVGARSKNEFAELLDRHV
jgi:thioredoxin 1